MAKNLTEISSALAKMYPGLTNKKALSITRSVVALIIKGLVEIEPDSRDRVALAEFGNFGVKKIEGRKVRNIKTKEMMDVPANVRITFKASDSLRKTVFSRQYEVPAPDDASAFEGSHTAKAETAEREEQPAKPKAKKAANPKAENPLDVDAIPDLANI